MYVVREEVIFSVCLSVHISGGIPSSWWGVPIQGPDGGGPHPRSRRGIPLARSRWGGYPIPGPSGGYPIQGPGRGHPPGVPPGQGVPTWVTPRQGGTYPGYLPGRGVPTWGTPGRGHLPRVPPGRGSAHLGYPPQQGGACPGTPLAGGCLPRVPPLPAGGHLPRYPPPSRGAPAQGTPWQGGPPAVPPPPPSRSSIACTCYAAVGMPLAFTQEDFLVFMQFSRKIGSSMLLPHRGWCPSWEILDLPLRLFDWNISFLQRKNTSI